MIRTDGSRGAATPGARSAEELEALLAERTAELERSEARLRETQRVGQLGSWELDLVSNRLLWSDEIFRIFEVDPKQFEATYEAFLGFVHPEDRQLVNQAFADSVSRRAPYEVVHRLRMPCGRIKYVQERGETSYDATGRPVRSVGTVQDITVHRETELALERSESNYRQIFNSVSDAMFIHDAATGAVLDVNDSMKSLYGFSHEEALRLGPNDSSLGTSPYAAAEVEIWFHKAIQEGPQVFEWQARRKTGEVFWVEVSLRSATINDQPRVLAVVRDISQRKHTEAALLETRDRLAVLFDGAKDAVFIADPDTGILLDANAAAADLLRIPKEKIIGLHQTDLHPRESAQKYRAQFKGHAEGSTRFTVADVLRADGTLVPVEINGSLVTLADGRRLVQGIFRDISERHRSEAALAESEARFRTLAEESLVGVYVIQDGRFQYVNSAFASMMGSSIPELLALSSVLETVAEVDRARMGECLHNALASSARGVNERFTAVRKDGERCLVEVLASVTNLAGRPAVLGSALDITERERLEAQLRQAQKLEAIGQLAGGVAHDFNNILAAVMMHVGLLQLEAGLAPAVRQTLKDIQAGIRRAASLTDQLLMFSRRSVMAIKPVDLNDLVADLLKMLRRLIGEHVELRFDGGGHLFPIAADRGLIEQVLMNLVVNARDAMPGGGRITINTSVLDFGPADAAANVRRRPGKFVQLSVSDHGCGMDAPTLRRIFEPFFTTKPIGKGSGLGLATVDGIVAQHQGWVEVESKVGAGTVFRVLLPALEEAEVSTESAEAQASPQVRGGSEVILLVEDEPDVRTTVARMLRTLGYQVHEAATGPEALKIWKAHGPSIRLLMTDMVMPEGMTGMELAQQLRKLSPGLKVLITSGYSAEIAQAGIPAKRDVVYLPKPFMLEALADAVRGCLDAKSA